MDNYSLEQNEGINVTRYRFDSLVIYEITEDELEDLQSSSRIYDIMLNAFFFLLSTFVSIIISLLSTTMNDYVKAVFTVGFYCVLFLIIVFVIIIAILYKSKKSRVDKIKSRNEKTSRKSADSDSTGTE